MKNAFYFIVTILVLTSCTSSVEEQLEQKKLILQKMTQDMERITQEAHQVIDDRADAELFLKRLIIAGATKNSKEYRDAEAEVERLSLKFDSLNVEADKITIAVEKLSLQIDSLLSLE